MTSTTSLIVTILALLSCCISTTAEETITLSLPVWLLELTIKIQEPFRRNLYGNLRRGLSPLSSTQHGTALQISGKGESRELQTTSDKIDAAIQSTAEQHLKNIYAEQFNMEPTQVLLTVVTNTPSTTSSTNSNNSQNNEDEELIEYEEVSTNGIYVRSSFLGGVVTFDNNEDNVSLPTRSELQSVTLDAFSIPGKGEIFLQNLKEYNTPDTLPQLNPGLLLISASEVKRNDIADSNAADLATTNSNIYEGSAPAITPANTNNSNGSGGNDMNIWAVAAVAALGAMFIVIVTCTSILYCDWRKRKERRERRRERAFNMQMQQQQGGMMGAVYNSGGGSNYARSNDGKKNYTNMEIDGDAQQQQLQIVVPHASSGDTEEYDGISPSTQASNNNNTNSNIGRDGMMMESKKGSLLGNIVNKSRRSLIKSKAAKEQLQEANAASIPSSQPLSAQGEYQSNDYNTNNMNNNHMNNNPAADMSVTDCGYSVGEDTTMLYPTINRNRTNSKDNMSDWDGYSMDGMSAIGDGGVSQYGGSGKGGGGSGGVHSSKNKGGGESRDMYYSGDVPRDFDSVWGDDESKLTMDGTDVNSVDYNDNGAARAALMAAADGDSISDYNMPPSAIAASSRNNNADLADLTQNLNQLVDQELGVTDIESVEQTNTSTSSAGKLDEFIDSDSASGSGHNFTLELLGKKSKSKLTKGTSAGSSSVTPSVDDDDSILGDLYKDDTMSELGGGLGDDISAIEGVAEEDDEEEDDEGGGTDGKNASSGDSVDSTPSWAEKIQSAVGNSAVVSNIFRTSSKGMLDNDEEDKMDTPAPSKDEEDDEGESSSSQAQRIKNKFMSGLISDDSSVGSGRSNRSRNSTSSKGSRGSHKSSSSRKANTAKSSSEKALGLTNSMDEEVDEDPAAMIDNINSMLSECRDILDTEKDTAGEP